MLELREHPRQYLTDAFDATDAAAVRARFDELEARDLPDADGFRSWIRDADELITAVRAEQVARRVATTRFTDDPSVLGAFRSFMEEIYPLLTRRSAALDRKLLACPFHADLDPDQYGEFLNSVRTRDRIFRTENIPLQVRLKDLETEFNSLLGATVLEFEGGQYTLSGMRRFLQSEERVRREAAWRALAERRFQDRNRHHELFEGLFGLRHEVATNAGFPDFRAYRFAEWRRCYTPDQCGDYHAAVLRYVVPLQRRLEERRAASLGVDRLRPWDVTVDPSGRPPLRPFRDGTELIAMAKAMSGRVHPEFGARLDYLERQDLLDLETRPGKGPGGYMCELPDRRVPFIFMNAAGIQRDVNTVLHEGGHAFHLFEARDLEPSFNRSAPMEFSEVASMAMELMALQRGDACYAEEDLRRARLDHLRRIPALLCWVAVIDSFQHEVYTRPRHTREDRGEIWMGVRDRFRTSVDYSGFERDERILWQAQPHLFRSPFYYIEYALAQLGALQIWLAYRRDPEAAVAAYRRGLSLGGRRPVPELFRAAGARFVFGGEIVGELMEALADEITGLESALTS